MKNILFTTALLVSTLVASAQIKKIGVEEGGQYKITDNIELVKTEWAQILKEQKNDAVLTTFEIRAAVNNSDNKKIVILFATNEDKSVKMATTLSVKNGVVSINLANNDFANGGIVICQGCKEGCDPEREGKSWICNNSCGPQCLKTETISGID